MTILDSPDTLDRQPSLRHDRKTFLYALAIMFSKASYFGIRALLVLFLIEGVFEIEQNEAVSYYGWLASLFLAGEFIGAFLGDLLLGNRKTIILALALQTIGAFSICVPEFYALYPGLFMLAVGGGMFTANIFANYSKLYLNKIKLLDAAYSIFYVAINLGSFLGVAFLGYIGEVYGWYYGFVLAGLASLFSLLPMLYLKEEFSERVEIDELSSNKRFFKIALVLLLSAIFASLYSILSSQSFILESKLFEVSTWDVPHSYWGTYTRGFSICFALFCSVLWSYYYSSQSFKLIIGFILMIVSIALLLIVPSNPMGEHVPIYFVAMFFLGAAAIYIGPVVFSVIAQYTNPKYLAIVLTCAKLPARAVVYLSSLVAIFHVGEISKQIYWIVMITAILCCVVVGIFLLINKQKRINTAL